MKRIRILVLLLGFGLCCLSIQAKAAVGIGMGVRSNSTHPQYPTLSRGESMQTNLGLQVKEEDLFSTLLAGSVDLIGHIAADGGMSQSFVAANTLRRNFSDVGVGVGVKNTLQATENEGSTALENLSTSVTLSRALLPTVEGRVIGGYNYNHLQESLLLMGLGLSTEVMSFKIDIDLWVKESPSLVGVVSREMSFYTFTLGTTANAHRLRAWVGFKVFIDDLGQQ